MPNPIPEITFRSTQLIKFITNLEEKLIDFEIKSIIYTGDSAAQNHFAAADELERHLLSLEPLKRTDVTIEFRYRRTQESLKKTSAAFYLTSTSDTSCVQVFGGTKAIQNNEKIRLQKILNPFKRKFSNKFISAIFLIAFPIAAFVLNFFFFPEEINKATAIRTFICGIAGFPFVIYAFYRPHVFHHLRTADFLKVFPGFIKTFLSFILWIGIFWAIIKSPRWSGQDSRLIAKNPTLQKEILRTALTPKFLSNIENLASSNNAYDGATGVDQKENIATLLTSQIYEAINSKTGLGKYPIENLPLFFSAAQPPMKGNWLAENYLLMVQVKPVGDKLEASYIPELDNPPFPVKYVTLDTWLNEPVIKDKYGRIWTRLSLIKSRVEEKDSVLSEQKKNDLERLRTGSHIPGIEFKSFEGNVSKLPNTVEPDTIRAISGELIRSLNEIQHTLSESPEAHSDLAE